MPATRRAHAQNHAGPAAFGLEDLFVDAAQHPPGLVGQILIVDDLLSALFGRLKPFRGLLI